MSLLWLLAILVVGGAVAWLSERRSGRGPRLVALGALALDALLLIQMLYRHAAAGDSSSRSGVIAETSWSWIAALGIRFHLVLDGLSAILALLVIVLGFAAVACSWSEIRERVGLLSFQPPLGARRNPRRVSLRRPPPLLFLLGAHARSHVPPHRDLGSREPEVRRDQVLSVHPGRRSSHARRDRGARHLSSPGHGRLVVRLPHARRSPPSRERSPWCSSSGSSPPSPSSYPSFRFTSGSPTRTPRPRPPEASSSPVFS